MIFKKTSFNKTKARRELWPFSCSEIAVVCSTIQHQGKPLNAFIIVHNFGVFALSGVMEQYGIPNLETAGIWLDEPTQKGVKRSLTPFFEIVTEEMEKHIELQAQEVH
jgi:hypothetical protein